MYISGEPGGVYDEEEEGEGGTAAKRITLVDLPIPEVTEVAAYAGEHTPDFVQPLSYIKFPIRLAEFDDGELEYDLDHEDEVRCTRLFVASTWHVPPSRALFVYCCMFLFICQVNSVQNPV